MHLAYIDAASGSMLIQAIVAGVAGLAVFAKLFWRRLTSPFRRKTETRAHAGNEPVAAKSDER